MFNQCWKHVCVKDFRLHDEQERDMFEVGGHAMQTEFTVVCIFLNSCMQTLFDHFENLIFLFHYHCKKSISGCGVLCYKAWESFCFSSGITNIENGVCTVRYVILLSETHTLIVYNLKSPLRTAKFLMLLLAQ